MEKKSIVGAQKFQLTVLIVLCSLFSFPRTTIAKDLFFTYAGLTFSSGMNKIKYNDWFDDQRETHDITGTYYMPGIVFDVFVNDFIGELSLDYLINKNDDSDTSIQHMSWKTKIKYAYSLNNIFALTIGTGLYLETPPATKKYDGAGGIITTGIIYTSGWNWKIFMDMQCQYGYFGLGEDSTKLSYGATIGIIRKIGKL